MRAVAVSVLVLLTACGGDDAEPLSVGGATTSTTAAPAAAALALPPCSELRAGLDDDPVGGPLSADPEVAAAQRNRARPGLPSDVASTEAALADPATPDPAVDAEATDLATALGPMTADEVPEVLDRYRRAQAAADAVGPLLEGRRELGTTSVEPATGLAVVRTAGDVAALQAELDAAVGPGRVRVEAVAAGEAELAALAEEVRAHLDAAGVAWSGMGTGDALGRVSIDLEVVDPVVVADLAAAFGDDGDLLCVDGADPADVIPDGPQSAEGDGWRLLADEPGAGEAFATGSAVDQAGYEALWAEIGLTGEPPAVDFEREAVVWFGPAVSGSCPDIRLDDVVVDGGVGRPVIVLPGGWRACTDDANPHAYVVAGERSLLPDDFTVELEN